VPWTVDDSDYAHHLNEKPAGDRRKGCCDRSGAESHVFNVADIGARGLALEERATSR
jgi:hypothetical protein